MILLGEVPPLTGMVEVVLDAADMAVQPADIADVVVAEVLLTFGGGGAPLRHIFEGHVAIVVIQMFERIFREDGFGGAFGLVNPFAALEEAAWIAVGGVLVVVGKTGQQAVDGTARIVIDITGDGAAEVLLVASIAVDANAPVEGVGSEGVFVVVVHVGWPATGVRVDDIRPGVEHGAVTVFRVHGDGQTELFEVADARCGLGFHTGLGQCGQQHGGENCDDGDNHQQLDQGEVKEAFHGLSPWLWVDETI